MCNDVRIGDTSTHGGVVVTGSGRMVVEGSPTSRIGDILMCPIHGPQPIVTGASKMVVEGSPTARIGDLVACGAVLCSGASKLVIGS